MTPEERYAAQFAGKPTPNPGRYGGVVTPVQATAKPITPTKQPQSGFFPLEVAKQGFDINKMLLGKTAGFVKNTVVDVGRNAYRTARTVPDLAIQAYHQKQTSVMVDELTKRQKELTKAYEAGTIDKVGYNIGLKAIQDGLTAVGERAKKEEHQLDGFTAERTRAVIDTAANVLSLGSYLPVEAAAKSTGVAVLDKALTGIDDFVAKIPAARDLVERNIAKIGVDKLAKETVDQMLIRNGKSVAAGLLIKRPFFYQQNIGGAVDIYNDLIAGKYPDAVKSAAWLGTQALSGGPIGAFYKGLGWMKGKLGKLAYGTGSYIDEISKRMGDGNSNQIARFIESLKDKAPEEYKKAERVFRIMQETNLRVTNNRLEAAVDNTLSHYEQHGYNLKELTPSQLYKDMSNWAQADELAQKTLRSGLVRDVAKDDAAKYAVVRWDTTAKKGLVDAIMKTDGSPQAMLDAINELADRPGVGWGNNRILMRKLAETAAYSGSKENAAKAIKNISTASTMLKGVPKKVAEELSGLGFAIAEPFGSRLAAPVNYDNVLESTRRLITAYQNADSNVFDIATRPQPELAFLARGLEKAGLSPRAANDIANQKLGESVIASLDGSPAIKTLGITGYNKESAGRAILSKLQEYLENKRPVFGVGQTSAITDIRQLRINEIAEALGVEASVAKNISRAISDGYMKVPLEFRGLGDRAVDYLYKYVSPYKGYSRLQSALRYTYNPFFRVQERVETAALTRLQGHNLIWMKKPSELDEGVDTLTRTGFFSSAINRSLAGEAATDQSFGRITANISRGQKRDLAGLAMRMAKTKGLTLEQMAIQNPNELEDALRVVVQYPRHGLIASPLARTINLAFFPMRYNLKVANLAAKELAKAPPSVQLATINGLFKMGDWLKSDEGIRWQAQHADAIKVFNWLTPINSIQYSMNLLQGHLDGPGSLGLLGGLPLGFITQMLNGQGLIDLNKPYVDPKTGDQIPDYIPKTTRARAATALSDLIGSVFTYPGRTLGLPGKQASVRKLVDDFISTNGKDFDKRIDTSKLTDLQKATIRVLKGDTSKEALDALYMTPANGRYEGNTIPSFDFPITNSALPIRPLNRTGLPAKATGKKPKKIAQPIQR